MSGLADNVTGLYRTFIDASFLAEKAPKAEAFSELIDHMLSLDLGFSELVKLHCPGTGKWHISWGENTTSTAFSIQVFAL